MLIERGIAANTSTDVMVGTYVQTLDLASDPVNSVLPQKIWVEIDNNGKFVAHRVRNANNDAWITIAVTFDDFVYPNDTAISDLLTLPSDPTLDEMVRVMKSILKRLGGGMLPPPSVPGNFTATVI